MGKPVGAVVQRAPAPPVTVNPLIVLGAPGAATPPPPVVVVKKAHTNPARTRITLRTSSNFQRSGTLSRTIIPTSGNIHIFTAAIGGTEIDFVGNTNTTFAAGRLNAGVPLFAEARGRSGAANDFQLTLTLAAGPTPVGPAATITLTAIDVTLDVAVPRTSAAVDPPILSETDKINPGRFVQVRDPQFSHLRAMLILRLPNPNVPVTFRLEALRKNTQAFGAELPAAGQTAQPNPATFPSGIFPAGGMQLFVEGTSVSTTVRNTGFRLGIDGLENEADSVVMTAYELALTTNTAPFNTAVSRVQIEGLLNRDLASYDLGDLFGTQSNSLIRMRVNLPGITGNVLQVDLVSNAANGTLIERQNVNLTRTNGDRFLSLPILAIPIAIPRTDITFATPQDIEVIRSIAGGALRMEPTAALTGTATVQAAVRGRIVEMCTVTIQGAAPSINTNLTIANRVMAQGGIEFRLLTQSQVDNPALLDIQQTNCPLTIGGDASRDAEETALFALGRSCATNFVIYFVRSNSLGLNGCSAFPVGSPGVTIADTASQYTFCHEICHVLHLPHDGRTNNLMTGAGTANLPANPANVNLLPDQFQTIDSSGFIVFRG